MQNLSSSEARKATMANLKSTGAPSRALETYPASPTKLKSTYYLFISFQSVSDMLLSDLEDDSPYPQVRAAVPNTDDPSMPVNTFRVWFLGLLTAIIFPGLNAFFGLRCESSIALRNLSISHSCSPNSLYQFVGHPVGCLT